jgi:hypothetical protein
MCCRNQDECITCTSLSGTHISEFGVSAESEKMNEKYGVSNPNLWREMRDLFLSTAQILIFLN